MLSRSITRCFVLVGLLLAGPVQAVLPGVVTLDGPWQVVAVEAGQAELDGFPDREGLAVTASLPKLWIELAGEDSTEVWLRQEVARPPGLPETEEALGLLIPADSWGRLDVWLDGHPVASRGEDGGFSGSAVPKVVELSRSARLVEGSELVLRCLRPASIPRSWLERWAPLAAAPMLGDKGTLQALAEKERLERLDAGRGQAMLAVFLAALGWLHLYLFSRRHSPEYLWFALAALDVSIALIGHWWLGEMGGDLLLGIRLRDCAAHLLVALMIQLLWTVLGRPISVYLRVYQGSHGVLAFVALFLGPGWVLWSSGLRWFWGLLGWGAMMALVLWSARRLGLEGRILGAGSAIVVVFGSWEWLAYLLGRGEPFTLSGFAFLVFAVAMAVSLGGRFHRASAELEVLHHQLERMVEDRSAELSAANERLRSEIAERQLAEEAMRMLERAVEQSIDGILVTDLEGCVQFTNQAWAAMHGTEPFEALGHGLELFHSERQMAEDVESCLEEVRRQGAFAGEVAHRRSDGKEFPCWTTVTLLRDGEGADMGYVFVGRDVSQQRSAEEEQNRLELKVRQAKKLESLGNLAGGIAHDYNNLLTGVLGNATLLERSLDATSSARDKVGQIELAAERAAELTSQLLAYAGEDPLVIERCTPSELVRELEPGLRALVPGGVPLDLEVEDGLPGIGLDSRQVGWALRNLVRNAVEALGGAREGGITVTFGVREADRSVFAASYLDEGQNEGIYFEIEVRDTGCGIDPETKERIFDPFFSTRASARGLGLATVLGVVRAHRGAVVVDSTPGEGTSFCLLFPIEPDVQPIPVKEPSRVDEQANWQGSGKILVVDDESLMREVSASILEEQGFEVLTASEGKEAVAIYRRELGAIRLVLLDCTMPRMSGDRVLHEIRQMNDSALVVMMSGFQRREALAGLEGEPPSGFIQKPFRPDELVTHLRRWLEVGGGELEGSADGH